VRARSVSTPRRHGSLSSSTTHGARSLKAPKARSGGGEDTERSISRT
jgi:hypothetical protein